MKKFFFLLFLVGFSNPTYSSSIKVENKNPEIKWIEDLARGIENDPDNSLIKYIQFFRSQPQDPYKEPLYEECIKGEDFLQGKKYCIMSIARVSLQKPFLVNPEMLSSNRNMVIRTSFGGTVKKIADEMAWAAVCAIATTTTTYIIVAVITSPLGPLPTALLGLTSTLICLAVNKYESYESGKKLDKKLDKIIEKIDNTGNRIEKIEDRVEKIEKSQNEHESHHHGRNNE